MNSSKLKTVFLASQTFLTAFAASLFVLFQFKPVQLTYYPVLRTWSFVKIPDAIGMGWYGAFGLATLAAAAITLAIYPLLKAACSKPDRFSAPLMKAWGTLSSILLVALSAWMIWTELTHWILH